MSEVKVQLEELFPLMEECLKAGRSFTFSPHGSSMLPMLRQGKDTVTLSPLPERLRKYDLPLYRRRTENSSCTGSSVPRRTERIPASEIINLFLKRV